MSNKPPYYRIYLLTVWQERSRGPPRSNTERITWRFRLEDPRTGRQQVFADAAMLMNALHTIVLAAEETTEEARDGTEAQKGGET